MKNLFIAVAVIVVLAGGYFLYAYFSKSAPTTTIDNPTTFPISGDDTTPPENTFDVETYAGTTVPAKDFIANGETVADIENPGSYVLAGTVGYCLPDGSCPAGAPVTEYHISYNKNTDFFNVILLSEPLGDARKAAEEFLKSRLGLSAPALCTLRYFVGTPYWVNEQFDNKNLGFSFCPGATKLP